MEASELNEILDQHKLWLDTNGVQGEPANLEAANLSGAYLKGAYLKGANLYYANLTDANLTDANLTGANLTGANLTDANLYGAYLTGAYLTGANLYGAYLTGANLNRAILAGAILSGIKGLPDIAWIKAGCLVQLNKLKYAFYLSKEVNYPQHKAVGFLNVFFRNFKHFTENYRWQASWFYILSMLVIVCSKRYRKINCSDNFNYYVEIVFV